MDVRWKYLGVTATFLDSKATWLGEARELHWRSHRFFRIAGKLLSLSSDDYELSSVAFYQAVFGLEVALRLHFASNKNTFAALFKRSIAENVFTDGVLTELRPFATEGLLAKEELQDIVRNAQTHCDILSYLIPKLRNMYVHGNYAMSPEHIHLTIQMRELADALETKDARPLDEHR